MLELAAWRIRGLRKTVAVTFQPGGQHDTAEFRFPLTGRPGPGLPIVSHTYRTHRRSTIIQRGTSGAACRVASGEAPHPATGWLLLAFRREDIRWTACFATLTVTN